LSLINKHNGSNGYPWKNGGITLPFILQPKMTPFMALYGYHPPSITSSLKEKSKVQEVEDHIEHQQQVLQILKDNLTMAQNNMEELEETMKHHIIQLEPPPSSHSFSKSQAIFFLPIASM
jgi:hypothetical protein